MENIKTSDIIICNRVGILFIKEIGTPSQGAPWGYD
jgi:hypothetical protein